MPLTFVVSLLEGLDSRFQHSSGFFQSDELHDELRLLLISNRSLPLSLLRREGLEPL
jgi:hypothetical protein